jgi:hypothetical protein
MFHDSPAISPYLPHGGYHVMPCDVQLLIFLKILAGVLVCHALDWLDSSPVFVIVVLSCQIPPRLVRT